MISYQPSSTCSEEFHANIISTPMDLEVDQRWRDAQEKITDSHPSERILVPDEVTLKPSLATSHAKQTRSSRFFFFFIGLAVGIALVAIVAGVAGSIAVQRQSKLNSYELSSERNMPVQAPSNTLCSPDVFRPKTPRRPVSVAPVQIPQTRQIPPPLLPPSTTSNLHPNVESSPHL